MYLRGTDNPGARNVRQLFWLFGLSWLLLGAGLGLRTGNPGFKLGPGALLDHRVTSSASPSASGHRCGLGGQTVVEHPLLEEVEVQSRDGAQLLVDVELVPVFFRFRFSGKRHGLGGTVRPGNDILRSIVGKCLGLGGYRDFS